MDRTLFLLLIMGFGLNQLGVKADPIAPNTTGNAVNPIIGKAKQPLNVKAKGKSIQKAPLRIRNCDHHAVGDFGPLPTNSFKPKNHNEGGVSHPSDFGTVPIEQGPDTRTAK